MITTGLIKYKPMALFCPGHIFSRPSLNSLSLHMAASVQEYLVQLVLATRNPQAYGEDLMHWVSFGASPRGTIALDRCSRAHAWLSGRDYVSPEDVQAVFLDVLRHRVLLSYEAEAKAIRLMIF